ncbi:MAG TPA: cytidylate kinase-like family protein [Lachnospiraceae bacterium]|nr:cytidylate kinase-like family protein [Lachnospiraceae bacterium]
MEHVIVTIARQYGSGGKTIGQMLADDMNVSCYEREILHMASEDSGINEYLFAQVDERIRTNTFFKMKHIYKGALVTPESDGFTSDDNLFNYQAKIIKKLAEKDSCVIIGRCADYILKDYPNVVSIFVHADPQFCKKSALERVSVPEKDIMKYIEKTDKYRGDYYKAHTGHEWHDLRNYDLCLNSASLGFEKCVEEIKAYIKIRFN